MMPGEPIDCDACGARTLDIVLHPGGTESISSDWLCKRCREAATCADCGGPIGQDKGPPDGWQLEDGRTVCHACCVADLNTVTLPEVKTLDELLSDGGEIFGRDLERLRGKK